MNQQPLTLSSIKNEAKKRNRSLGTPHMQALEEISRLEGYSNYKEAMVALSVADTRNKIEIWQNYSDGYNTIEGGCVEGSVFVTKPPSFYINPQTRKAMLFKLDKTRNVELYRIQYTCVGKDMAKEYVSTILKTIQFIEATGFLPTAKSSLASKYGRPKPPWADHSRVWMHHETGDVLFSEEPSLSRLEQHGDDKENWARTHGFEIALCNWGSIYSSSTEMVLMMPYGSSISLNETLLALNKANLPIKL